jgi:3-hydroxyisobutyrate dehydrogenase
MDEPTVGFLGLGLMGEPMALNLARAGTPLVVWNRTPERTQALRAAGATVAPDVASVFAQADVVLVMLAHSAAIDAVLGRSNGRIAAPVAGRLLVPMGTTAPAYSQALRADVIAAGGRYVEAPVSGSRIPAQHGELVAMLAGEPEDVALVAPLLAPVCRQSVPCGPVPNALVMKLAVNLYLLTLVAGLAEAVHFAQGHGLDLDLLRSVLDGGQMASPISRVKLAKLVDEDLSPQAAAADVLYNADLVATAARAASLSTPLLDASHALYAETVALGRGSEDMAAVLHALHARTTALATPARPSDEAGT